MTNVALTIDDLAGQITAEHFAAIEDARSAVKHARKAGEYLMQAKDGCRHGDWLPWLREHCSEIPERMAQRYMQVAGHPELEADSLRDVLFKLAAPRQPAKATRVSDLNGEPAASVPPPASASESDDDAISAANAEIKRQAAEIATLRRKTERQAALIDALKGEITALKAGTAAPADTSALDRHEVGNAGTPVASPPRPVGGPCPRCAGSGCRWCQK